MTPGWGARPPVPSGAPRDPESALGLAIRPAGVAPPVSRWPIPSAAGSERSGFRVRAWGMWGRGAHLRNDKLPTIGSGDVQNPPKPVTVLPWASEMGRSVDWRVRVGRNRVKSL